jgi:single-strand DNA-binding protein
MGTMQLVMMVARVAADPDMRFLSDGRCVTRFTVATDRLRSAGAPEAAPATDWHRVVCWERLGQIAGEYLRKGRLVYVEGRLSYRSFETRDGQTRNLAEIVAASLLLLDRPPVDDAGEAAPDLAEQDVAEPDASDAAPDGTTAPSARPRPAPQVAPPGRARRP